MRFAKIVFNLAGIYGILVLSPLYFLFDRIGRQDPPPITHPQFFYGFAGLGIVWQIAFLVIGADPVRFRPMMIPAVLEKASYVLAVLVLLLQNRLSIAQAATAVPDAILGCLFAAAFLKTPRLSVGKENTVTR